MRCVVAVGGGVMPGYKLRLGGFSVLRLPDFLYAIGLSRLTLIN